ncbi:MAG: type II toxin-antitoxin system Phd/YefM family antitoxin [Vicinamibacteria bacterium]
MKTMTLTQARDQLLKVAEEMERKPDHVVEVVKRGKKVMTLLSAEVYDALVETLEIVADETAYAKLRRALREIESGKGISWGAAREKLDLSE